MKTVNDLHEEYYSYHSDDEHVSLSRLPDPEPPHIPLGWFLVIMAVDIACLVAIYAGIAKALHR